MAHDDDDDSALHIISTVCLFVFGATVPTGPGPPHSRGF
jgi:hypothetical protein